MTTLLQFNAIVAVAVVLVTLAMPLSAAAATSCVASAGQLPALGKCDGPTERAVVRLENVETFNSGCSVGLLGYRADDDPSAPLLCGECVPGTAGAEDANMSCGINQFCNDNATCTDLNVSPLYGEPCPYEQGGLSAVGWCGPGLRCIEHACRICEEGVIDPRDGKRCVNGEWTYSAWAALGYNPEAVLLIVIIVLMVLKLLMQIIIRQDSRGRFHIVGLKFCSDALRKKIKARVKGRSDQSGQPPQQHQEQHNIDQEGLPYPQYPQPQPPEQVYMDNFLARQ